MPQNNEVFDYNPEYAKLYQTNDSQPSDADDMGDRQQRASELPPEVQGAQDGKKAANVSLLFGFLGLLFFFLGCWWFVHDFDSGGLRIVIVAPLLNVLGAWQGRVANRHGVPALAGRILSWAGVGIVLALYIFVILFLISLSHSL